MLAAEEGRWDEQGAWVPTSDQWAQGTLSVAGAWRFTPWLSASGALSGVGMARSAGALRSVGGGLGDAVLGLRLEPWDPMEHPLALVVTLGAILPTGRPAERSDDPLQADVTGQGDALLSTGLGLEHTLGDWPWHVAARHVGAPEAPESRVELQAGLGRALGPAWVVKANAGVRWGYAEGSLVSALDVVGARPLRPGLRGWVGAGLDLPLSGVGRSLHGEARGTGGLMWVW